MPTNKLEILLTLKDTASIAMKKVQGNLKNFATSMKNNWLAVSASVTAAILAINKAWNMLEVSAKAEQQRKAFNNMTTQMGVDSAALISSLKQMSGETMATMEIVEKASKAIILGLDPSKLSKMMEISRASARAMGTDVGFMFDSIAMGVGRQSRMILDNLGIIVKADEAYQNYADALGKNTSELTDLEKRQAFLNATLEAGEEIIKKVNIQAKSNLEYMQSMKAWWENLQETVGSWMWAVIKAFTVVIDLARSGFAQIAENSLAMVEQFFFGIIKLAEGLEILSSKIPILGEGIAGITEKLQEMSENVTAYKEGFSELGDDWAEQALAIAESFDTIVTPSINRSGKAAEDLKNKNKEIAKEADLTAKKIMSSMGNAMSDMISGTKSAKEAMSDFGKAALKAITDMIAQMIIQSTIGQAIQTALTASLSVMGGVVAQALAPAAAMASLMSFGGNAAPAMAGMTSTMGLATALAIPKLAEGGIVTRPTMALIGEAGPEAVIPLDGAGRGGITIENININGNVDSDSITDLAEQLGFEIDRQLRYSRGI